MRVFVTAVAISMALAGAASAATPAPNVVGVFVRPAVVNCDPNEPCDPPAVGLALVFTRNGHVVARVRVGATGRFALHLTAGRYTVRAAPPPTSGALTPATFRVPRVGVLHLRLQVR
jgi:hypothetical protein